VAYLFLVRPVRRLTSLLFLSAILVLVGCATDRYRWTLAHAYMSPRARQLPRAELEEIVWLVSHAWDEAIVGVGQACGEPPDTMHVVARYGDYRTMVFDLKRVSGHWRIVDHGDGTPFISTAWYGC
jgi:hypothetical protein